MRVPFAFDVNDGLVTVRGTASLDGDALVVEVSRHALQLVPMGQEAFRLPVDEIESIEVQTAFLRKARLVIRPLDDALLVGFPGDPVGELRLPVAKKSVAAARALVREARLRNLPR